MVRPDQFHQRLQAVVFGKAPAGSHDDATVNLITHLRSVGVRGPHASRPSVRRWLQGQGRPPDYWLDLVAKHFGVDVGWLKDGTGDPPKGWTEPAAPEPPATRPAAAEGDAPVAPPTGEEEVSMPTAEEVYESNAPTLINYIERTGSVVALRSILKLEEGHPRYEGGRSSVLIAAKNRIDELEG